MKITVSHTALERQHLQIIQNFNQSLFTSNFRRIDFKEVLKNTKQNLKKNGSGLLRSKRILIHTVIVLMKNIRKFKQILLLLLFNHRSIK